MLDNVINMNVGSFRKLQKLLSLALQEAEKEAIDEGVDITSDEYAEAVLKLREIILQKLGLTVEEYDQLKADFKKKPTYTELEDKPEIPVMPTVEEIKAIAKEVIPPPVAPIIKTEVIERTTKVVEKPTIKIERQETIVKELDTTETDKLRQDLSYLQESFSDLYTKVGNWKIPLFPDYSGDIKVLKDFADNTSIVMKDMPNWRALGMGLQGQIDEVKGLITAENLWDDSGTYLTQHTANYPVNLGSGNLTTTGTGTFGSATRKTILDDGTYAINVIGSSIFYKENGVENLSTDLGYVSGGVSAAGYFSYDNIASIYYAYIGTNLLGGQAASFGNTFNSNAVILSDNTYAISAIGNSLFTGAVTITGVLNTNGGSIKSSTGAISFDNENLSTTGTLGAGAITGTSFIIGAYTLSTEFEFLDGIGAYVYRSGGTDIAVADGGTNLSSYAVGDLLYASAATTIGKLADVAAGSYLRSGGVTTAPLWSTLILPNAITDTYVVCATGTNTYGSDAGLTYNDSTDLMTVTDSLTISGGTATSDGFALTGKISQTGITGASSTTGSAGSETTYDVGDGGAGTAGNGGNGGRFNFNTGEGGAGTKTSTTVTAGKATETFFNAGVGGVATGSGTCTLATGGIGSATTITGGTGGSASNSNTASTGGLGGGFTFAGGNGGASTTASGTTHIGGAGGAVSISSGTGANASGGTSNTGGDGGDVTLTAKLGGTGATASGANGNFIWKSGTTEIARFDNAAGTVGRFGIGIAPTAWLTLKAGSATAGTAPAKFTAGVSTTVAVAGQMEYDGSNFFLTPASTRKKVTLVEDVIGVDNEVVMLNNQLVVI